MRFYIMNCLCEREIDSIAALMFRNKYVQVEKTAFGSNYILKILLHVPNNPDVFLFNNQ